MRFTGRLELEYPTISLADLVLEKLQIVRISEKHVRDLIVVFSEHGVGASEIETINPSHTGELLSDE